MTPNIQFLINCGKSEPTAANIQQICAHASQLDSSQLSGLVILAHAHGILPLVYHALQSHAVGLISEKYLAEIKRNNMSIVAKNMHMAAELTRLLRLLNKNGIQALAFKGPALSQFAYEDITLREYCDLDILIKRQDARKAIALLIEDNYIPEIILAEDTSDTFFSRVNVIGLGKSIRIEIHWELLSKNYAIDWQEDALWEVHDNTTIDGVVVPMPAYNTHLLYLCAHGAKHLFERLEWVCDIDRFIRVKPDLDWQSLFKDAQAQGIERILMLGLYLSHSLLALPLPEKIKTKALNDSTVPELGQRIIEINFSTADRQGRYYGTFGILWRMRENLSDRLSFAYRALFAPKLGDFHYVELPSYLLFLYPIIRPFRLLMKYFHR
jgi:hypothetical protein